MKAYLKKLPFEIRDLVSIAGDLARAHGMRAFLVGGFVRDLILGVKNLDLDIVIEGDGIRFAEELARHLKAGIVCHKRFGTATVMISHALKIDVATAREETYPEPASLPVVKSGTVQDDLKRRDFSINAMALSINQDNYGELIDCFQGRKDLRDKKIRVLHELSFIDDPTRMVRAIRFEQRLGFKIEPETLRLLKEAAKDRMLEQVQPQRVRDELILILKEECPLKQIKRMNQLLGLRFIHKRLTLLKNNRALLESTHNQVLWFKKNYSQRRHLDSWLIYLMALIDPLALAEARSMCRKYVFRRGEEKRIFSAKAIRKNFINELSSGAVKPSRIFHMLDPLSYEVILLLRAKYRNTRLRKHIADFLEIYNFIRIEVTGHDLYSLGIKPGPFYQNLFAKVLKAKLDGIVRTKEEELALIHALAKIK